MEKVLVGVVGGAVRGVKRAPPRTRTVSSTLWWGLEIGFAKITFCRVAALVSAGRNK